MTGPVSLCAGEADELAPIEEKTVGRTTHFWIGILVLAAACAGAVMLLRWFG
jgi:hypothetical protein